MRCSRCGAELQSSLRVCPRCAATVQRPWTLTLPVVRCSECEGRVRPGVRICPHCGAHLRHSWWISFKSMVLLLIIAACIYALAVYAPWPRAQALYSQVKIPRWTFLATPTARPASASRVGRIATLVAPVVTEEPAESGETMPDE